MSILSLDGTAQLEAFALQLRGTPRKLDFIKEVPGNLDHKLKQNFIEPVNLQEFQETWNALSEQKLEIMSEKDRPVARRVYRDLLTQLLRHPNKGAHHGSLVVMCWWDENAQIGTMILEAYRTVAANTTERCACRLSFTYEFKFKNNKEQLDYTLQFSGNDELIAEGILGASRNFNAPGNRKVGSPPEGAKSNALYTAGLQLQKYLQNPGKTGEQIQEDENRCHPNTIQIAGHVFAFLNTALAFIGWSAAASALDKLIKASGSN